VASGPPKPCGCCWSALQRLRSGAAPATIVGDLSCVTTGESLHRSHGGKPGWAEAVFARALLGSQPVGVSLEDETGIANLVLMPDVYERFRPLVRGAAFLVVQGRVERNGQVVNVRVRSVSQLPIAPEIAPQARDFH